MSEDLKQPLLEQVKAEKGSPYYVLIFPNVFTDIPQGESVDSTDQPTIPLKLARERLDLILAPLEQLDKIYSKETALGVDAPKASLSQTLRDKIDWSKASFTTDPIPKTTFQKDAITVVIWLLEMQCGLSARFYFSRDMDEIFCTLECSEEKLRGRADLREYKVQMRNPEEEGWETYEFMKVFPYVEFTESISNMKILKHYDVDGEEASEGSLFSHVDKTRLTFGLISKMMSLENLKTYEVLKDHYCVHHELQLTQLKRDWATLFKVFTLQPLNRIRSYFGERVSLYFAWIGFYCWCMFVPAVVGALFFLGCRYFVEKNDNETYKYVTIVFSLFLSLWATFFDQLWVRNERELAWTWGAVKDNNLEEQRGEFRGEIFEDPVSGEKRKMSEPTLIRIYKHTTSFSVALLFVGLVFAAVFGIFMYKATLLQELDPKNPDQMAIIKSKLMTVGFLNAMQIKVMNFIYYIVARKMNDWENHETESEYTEALSVKLFMFRFINSYISLFYIAFVKVNAEGCGPERLKGEEGRAECSAELTYQLGSIFVFNMGFNLLELGIPYIKDSINVWLEERQLRKKRQTNPEMRATMSPSERQAKMAPYETPLEDYMEMVVQYGYVVMFSSVFTLVPLLALVEILIEIRVDSWKLCNLTRRPFPYKAETIGVWYTIIQIVSYMGIITNTALIMFASGVLSDSDSTTTWVDFIVLEHVLIVIKLILSMVIPDEPTVVKLGLQWSQRKAEETMYAKKVNFSQQVKWEMLRRTREGDRSFRVVQEQLCEGKEKAE